MLVINILAATFNTFNDSPHVCSRNLHKQSETIIAACVSSVYRYALKYLEKMSGKFMKCDANILEWPNYLLSRGNPFL